MFYHAVPRSRDSRYYISQFALFASTRDLLTRYAYMSWYPRFPSIVVEALITLLSFLEEEYLPFLRNIWRGKEELI